LGVLEAGMARFWIAVLGQAFASGIFLEQDFPRLATTPIPARRAVAARAVFADLL
jgi:hypothetical protein